MKQKIKETLKLFNEESLSKVNVFLSIMDDMKLGDDKKLEGILYYLLKLNKLSLEDVKNNYDSSQYNTVVILEKLDKINYSQQDIEAENIRKMFFAITKDIRIIMLKIAFVVVDLRNIENYSSEEKQQLASSIFSLFAPLAARLGLSTYKTELENGAFLLSQQELYNEIQQKVNNRYNEQQPIVEKLTSLVKSCMNDLNIQGRAYGRKKHIFCFVKLTRRI